MLFRKQPEKLDWYKGQASSLEDSVGCLKKIASFFLVGGEQPENKGWYKGEALSVLRSVRGWPPCQQHHISFYSSF